MIKEFYDVLSLQPNLIYELEKTYADSAKGTLNRQSVELIKSQGGLLAFVGLVSLLVADHDEKKPETLGGVETCPGEFPNVVAVGDREEYWASGILLKGGFVLTAGHVDALNIRDRVSIGVKAPISQLCGPMNCPPGRSPDDSAASQEVQVEKSARHPFFWDDPFFANDLALLKLKLPADDPLCQSGIDLDDLAPEQKFKHAVLGRIVGFGASTNSGSDFGAQKRVDVPILHEEEMANRYGFSQRLGFDWDREFVACAPLMDKDACSGDSGGGFFVKVEEKWTLFGMVSRQFGLRGSQCGAGSIYIRLDRYRDCIKNMQAYLDGEIGWDDLRNSCPRDYGKPYDADPAGEPTPCPSCGTKK